MKVSRKGTVKLQSGDYRVGNFIFHMEKHHVKVQDLSGITSWRVDLATSVGMLIEMAIKEKHDKWLAQYAAATFSQLCVVPDPAFFVKHAELVNSQVALHPEYYGKEQPTDDKEKDDAILEEERQTQQAIEEVTGK